MDSEDELLEVLRESPDSIAELLKSAAHRGRVEILSSLLSGERDLSFLVGETGLSKNALVNHLNMLMDRRLVERGGRGKYSLTIDGRDLISAVAVIYRDSEVRQERRRERMRSGYAVGWRVGGLSEKVISRTAEYQLCWISYTGAVAGALRSLGVDCDVVDVGGYSGYAFLVNVPVGNFCPSGPTAFHSSTWTEIERGTEGLGYELSRYTLGGGYPSIEGEPTPDDISRAKELFQRVKSEVDGDRPVVIWGLPIPEYGIVNGYKGQNYVTSTYRRLINPEEPEEPVLYYELQSPGELHAIFFKAPVERDAEEVHRKALERAVRFAMGKISVVEGYATGPSAFDEWAKVLESAHLDEVSYHGNSYVAACLHEAREMASGFLGRLAESYQGTRSESLRDVSQAYAESAEALKGFTELFPFSMAGEMPTEKRVKGAEILKRVKTMEDGAIGYLKEVVESW